MLFVNVFFEPFFGAESPSTVLAFVPVGFLLVLQAEPAVMARPSSVAPAAFDLV